MPALIRSKASCVLICWRRCLSIFRILRIAPSDQPPGIVGDVLHEFLDDLPASSAVLSSFFHSEILI